MSESIRLVIWDLDDTFWRGTFTEGGIGEYVEAHHDIVVTLAKRGIVSSICSKNDEDAVRAILTERGIISYFVFPSISWAPKGPRLAEMIENIHLRPETVLFIDDHPGNRAEAAAFVPGLQVVDETFIPQILSDPRFVGKPDPDLSRLNQYRLLERRASEQSAAASTLDFLRSSNIRVFIEHDVLAHIDRAVELINRTNQLNYTKRRLSDDIDVARTQLESALRLFNIQAGLIRVVDNYGDYGFVGFYMLQNRRRIPSTTMANQTLVHFCFSCRTLGMFVEQWAYEWLRRPELNPVGVVLTDLEEPRTVDWITQISSMDNADASHEAIGPEIRVYGGCEAHALSHYLSARSPRLAVSGNFASGGLFVRINSASLLLSALDLRSEDLRREADRLNLPLDLIANRFFDGASEGCLFVFSGGLDALRVRRYRHRRSGWEIMLDVDAAPGLDLCAGDPADLRKRLSAAIKYEAARARVLDAVDHLREHYESAPGPTGEELRSLMRDLLGRLPPARRSSSSWTRSVSSARTA